jgi:N-acylglucosamine-6-phosphate 2-epimerase
MTLDQFITQVRGGLIVSCQALHDEPLHGPHIMARMALAAQQGGAVGIRANGPEDIAAIREAVPLPIIGLYKQDYDDSEVFITPTAQHVRAVVGAGASVVALDATQRQRPNAEALADLIAAVHEASKLVLADVSTLDEARAAVAAGADLIAPTLSGYTPYSPQLAGPDYALLQAMASQLTVPVIAEGRIRTPEEARLALEYGAIAVVVGSAITRPQIITRTFADAVKNSI